MISHHGDRVQDLVAGTVDAARGLVSRRIFADPEIYEADTLLQMTEDDWGRVVDTNTQEGRSRISSSISTPTSVEA
jgi:hypothetical protein